MSHRCPLPRRRTRPAGPGGPPPEGCAPRPRRRLATAPHRPPGRPPAGQDPGSMNRHPQITVTRIESQWHAEVPALELDRQARTLFQLDRWVRCTFGPGWIDYQFRTGEAHLDRLIANARQARREARRTDERARDLHRPDLAASD